MSSLADYIDRLTSTVKSIKITAAEISDPSSHPEGPFTRAVLHTPLGDLIREVDSSELGLFTLVAPSLNQEKQKDEITRVEFPGATPLRRPPAARRDDAMRIKELEPEVYAQAALKYLDRYQSIRPMPRARSQVVAIIDQLSTTRSNIESLNQVLAEQGSSSAPPASPKSQIHAEERRIQDLQAKISQLRKRKEAVLKPKPRSKIARSKPITKPPSPPQTPVTPSLDEGVSKDTEDAFWQTPAASARILHFTDTMLMDEQPDLGDVSVGDVSVLSFGSPLKTASSSSAESSFDVRPVDSLGESESLADEEPAGADDSLEDSDEGEDDDDEGDKTVVLQKPVPKISLPPVPVPLPPPIADTEPPTPAQASQPKFRVNSEMERIVTKIWSTVGEIIMPGHPFDTSGSATGSKKPPRAKETIAHLQTLSSQSSSPASPSSASISSISAPNPPSGHPTTQQILTAHLLLTLLSSPPNFAMPLNKLKDTLASKVKTNGNAGTATHLLGGQVTTRTLYACVAKKLVKIERGGGEQVVKFDV